MQVAVRSYLTAGMTLVGAGAIALSPVAPSLPTAVHMPTVHQAAVDLVAATGPLETWVQVVTQSIANVGQLGQQVVADPAPILAQIVTNQLANAAVLGYATQETVTALASALGELPATLHTALGQLAAGDVIAATNTLLAPVLPFALGILQGGLDAYPVISNTAQNFANLLAAVPQVVLTEGLALTGPIYSVANAAAQTGQSVVDDAGTGDLAGVIKTLVNAPATFTGAVLNGYGDGPLGIPAAGLLTGLDNPFGSLGAGPIAVALDLRNLLADALKPLPAPPVATTLKEVEAKPATGSTTVALSTGSATAAPEAAAPEDDSPAATTGKSTKADSAKSGAVKTDDDTASAAAPATDSPVKGKHRAQTANPVKKLGANIKKALSGSQKESKKAEKASAGSTSE